MREQILNRARGRTVPLGVPEWGEGLFAKKLSLQERLGYEEWAAGDDDEEPTRKENTEGMVKLLIRSVVDVQCKRVFRDEDLAVLLGEDADVILAAFAVTGKLNAITRETVEGLGKNSGSGPSAASSSSSPGPGSTAPPTSSAAG